MTALLNTLPRIIGETTISTMLNGKQAIVNESHVNYNRIRDLFKDPTATVEQFEAIYNIPKSVHASSNGKIVIGSDMIVRFNGVEIHNALTTRMLAMIGEGFDVTALKLFMENLMGNPSRTAVNELYEFLEKNNLPITADGHFLAYKRVREDYLDVHSGTMDNSVGNVVQVARNEVDDNRDNECSYGLHFCSFEYLQHFYGGSGRIVIVKVNPKDVVAFPRDYNHTKGRTARYEVVDEHKRSEKEEAFDDKLFTSNYSDTHRNHEEDFSEDDDTDYSEDCGCFCGSCHDED